MAAAPARVVRSGYSHGGAGRCRPPRTAATVSDPNIGGALPQRLTPALTCGRRAASVCRGARPLRVHSPVGRLRILACSTLPLHTAAASPTAAGGTPRASQIDALLGRGIPLPPHGVGGPMGGRPLRVLLASPPGPGRQPMVSSPERAPPLRRSGRDHDTVAGGGDRGGWRGRTGFQTHGRCAPPQS